MKPYYDEGGITIYHGDCRDVLPALRHGVAPLPADALISDPPFAYAGGNSNGRVVRPDSQFFEAWLIEVFRACERSTTFAAPWLLWSDWRSASIYERVLFRAAADHITARAVKQVLVHDREMIGMGFPFRNQTDYIAVIGNHKTDWGERVPRNQSNVLRSYWYYGKHPHHPAEKDPALARQLIEWATDPGKLVLDPFAGGGAVVVAARQTGRHAIGIEIEERYCEIAAKRLQQMVLPLETA